MSKYDSKFSALQTEYIKLSNEMRTELKDLSTSINGSLQVLESKENHLNELHA